MFRRRFGAGLVQEVSSSCKVVRPRYASSAALYKNPGGYEWERRHIWAEGREAFGPRSFVGIVKEAMGGLCKLDVMVPQFESYRLRQPDIEYYWEHMRRLHWAIGDWMGTQKPNLFDRQARELSNLDPGALERLPMLFKAFASSPSLKGFDSVFDKDLTIMNYGAWDRLLNGFSQWTLRVTKTYTISEELEAKEQTLERRWALVEGLLSVSGGSIRQTSLTAIGTEIEYEPEYLRFRHFIKAWLDQSDRDVSAHNPFRQFWLKTLAEWHVSAGSHLLQPWARDWIDLLGKYMRKRVARLGQGCVLAVEVLTPQGPQYYKGMAYELTGKPRMISKVISDAHSFARYRSNVLGYTPFWMLLDHDKFKLDNKKNTLLDRWAS